MSSYFTFPRIHFSGRYHANPPTLNNHPDNLKYANLSTAKYELKIAENKVNKDWDSPGDGSTNLQNCVITRVYDENGKKVSKDDDRLLNEIIGNIGARINGRIVDLDQQIQGVSQLFGMKVSCDLFDGLYDPPAAVQRLWFCIPEIGWFGSPDLQKIPAVGGSGKDVPKHFRKHSDIKSSNADFASSAYFQSTITNVKYNNVNDDSKIKSPILEKMIEKSWNKNDLIVKFVVNRFNEYKFEDEKDGDKIQQEFSTGHCYGVIAPMTTENEPRTFVLGRHILPCYIPNSGSAYPPFGNVIGKVFAGGKGKRKGDHRLMLDFSNAFRRKLEGRGKHLYDYGDLKIEWGGGKFSKILKAERYLGKAGVELMECELGIITFSLNDDELESIEQTPIFIFCTKWENPDSMCLARESQNGFYIQTDQRRYRLDCNLRPDDVDCKTEYIPFGKENLDVYPLEFGKLNLSVCNDLKFGSQVLNNEGSSMINKKWMDKFAGKKEYELEFGKARIIDNASKKCIQVPFIPPKTLKGKIESKETLPRAVVNLDSLVYLIRYNFDAMDKRHIPTPSLERVGTLVWSKSNVPHIPTWRKNILPILQIYANLFPVMRNIIDLASFEDCTQKLTALERAFGANWKDGAYMPVTRDLSPTKVGMILKWMQFPVYSKNYVPIQFDTKTHPLDTMDDLRRWLQNAVILELATIPTYLSGLYSIKPEARFKNTYVYDLISSVVIQEMQHLSLAANVLLSIGGRPTLTDKKTLPKFPGPLPNDVRPDLVIHLGPLTHKQVYGTYMEIERPPEVLPQFKDLGITPPNGFAKDEVISDEVDKNVKKYTFAHETINELTITLPGTFSPSTMETLTADRLYEGEVDINDSDEKTGDIRLKNTIGEFYYQIKLALARFEHKARAKGKTIFDAKSIPKQVTNDEMDGVIVVRDLQTAFAAINEIVVEGEGASLSDLSDKSGQLSHFWKFCELAKKRRLYFNGLNLIYEDKTNKLNPSFRLGAPIEFNFDKDVYNVPQYDPKKDGSNIHVERFNTTYGNLLQSLEKFLNGDKKQLKANAIPLMRQMQVQYLQAINHKYGGKSVAPNFVPIFKDGRK